MAEVEDTSVAGTAANFLLKEAWAINPSVATALAQLFSDF